MNQSHPKAPFVVLLLLILIGTVAAVLAFWLTDRRQGMPDSGLLTAAALGIFFASYTGALVLYLRRRDNHRRTSGTSTSAKSALSQQELEGTIYGLIPGSQYQVIQPFTDYYGNSFEHNEILRFKERHFLPYEGGYTIVFDERSLYLQEEKNVEILENFSKYIVQIKQ